MLGSEIVIIGNGAAGNSAISAIRRVDREVPITLLSEEPLPEYSPCVLSKKFLSGEMGREEVFLKSLGDYPKEGVKAILGQKVFALDTREKRVLLKAERVEYKKLILATGSRPLIPPIEGADKQGIFTLKSLEDAEGIAACSGERAVVIGAGPIGVEASLALKKRGWKVCLVELLERVLPRAFDQKPAQILKKIIEDCGIEVLTGERVVRIEGWDRVQSVFTDRREIKCDLVLLVSGTRPEVGLAREAVIKIGALGGIRTDKQMRTSAEDVYACGDCVEVKDFITGKTILSPLWHNANEQGELAGFNCAGRERNYHGAVNIVGVDFPGVQAVSIGHTAGEFESSNLKVIEKEDKYFRRLLISEGTLVGAQFIGRTEDLGPLLGLMRRKEKLERIQEVMADEKLLSRNPWLHRLSPYLRL